MHALVVAVELVGRDAIRTHPFLVCMACTTRLPAPERAPRVRHAHERQLPGRSATRRGGGGASASSEATSRRCSCRRSRSSPSRSRPSTRRSASLAFEEQRSRFSASAWSSCTAPPAEDALHPRRRHGGAEVRVPRHGGVPRSRTITVEAFIQHPRPAEGLEQVGAGIALQAYLPTPSPPSGASLHGRRNVASTAGGAPVTIRIVKGANMEMERVEASIRGWPPGPFADQGSDTDANYKRMLEYALRPREHRPPSVSASPRTTSSTWRTASCSPRSVGVSASSVRDARGHGQPSAAGPLRRDSPGPCCSMRQPAAQARTSSTPSATWSGDWTRTPGPDNFLRHAFRLKLGGLPGVAGAGAGTSWRSFEADPRSAARYARGEARNRSESPAASSRGLARTLARRSTTSPTPTSPVPSPQSNGRNQIVETLARRAHGEERLGAYRWCWRGREIFAERSRSGTVRRPLAARNHRGPDPLSRGQRRRTSKTAVESCAPRGSGRLAIDPRTGSRSEIVLRRAAQEIRLREARADLMGVALADGRQGAHSRATPRSPRPSTFCEFYRRSSDGNSFADLPGSAQARGQGASSAVIPSLELSHRHPLWRDGGGARGGEQRDPQAGIGRGAGGGRAVPVLLARGRAGGGAAVPAVFGSDGRVGAGDASGCGPGDPDRRHRHRIRHAPRQAGDESARGDGRKERDGS